MIAPAADCHDSEADRDLLTRIRLFLAGLNRPALQRIAIDVHEGRVRLTGRVGTFYDKQLAGSCCRRVAGVRQLCDELEVSATPSHPTTAGAQAPAREENGRSVS